jgi:hypothetical protein
MKCASCGASLSDTQGKAHAVCRFCGTEVKLVLTPVESFQRHFDRKEQVQPQMNALMERYADLMGRGAKLEALRYYEAFTYLVLWTAQEVEELAELEAMVTPLMRDGARQIGVPYVPPCERGEQVTFASVDLLLESE